MTQNLKAKTANALLWSGIDKIFTQICYAVTGIVLANILMPEDFGSVAIIAVFTAFANIFIDGGFTLALIQKKNTTHKDYSTVFFLNISLSCLLYIILYLCAPLIAGYFKNEELTLLSRVMFLNVIFYSLTLVQSGMLMKEMNLKKQTIINVISLAISSLVALWMALTGMDVWALVVQALAYSFARSVLLWVSGKWFPLLVLSKESFKSIFNVGLHILLTSFVRTFFQNIYSLIIAGKYTLKDLGYYNQADKWSKMGTTAVAQTIGSAAFPALSSIQDEEERMRNAFGKINRMTSYLTFPALIWLIVMAEPIFHCFFKDKWDPSVILFQLLIIKGIFFVFISLLNNYIMATGKTRILFRLEVIKDVLALIAIVITLPVSIPALVIGLVIVEVAHYIIMAFITSKYTGYTFRRQIRDMLPYVMISLAICSVLLFLSHRITNEYVLVVTQGITAIAMYFGINKILNSKIQQEIIDLIRKKK